MKAGQSLHEKMIRIKMKNRVPKIFLIVLPGIWVAALVFSILCIILWGAKPWQLLTALATWILAGGVGFAAWQIREAEKSRNAQLAMSWLLEFRKERRISTLRDIYRFTTPVSFETVEGVLSSDMKDDIYYVLDQLDYLAFLVKNEIVSKHLAIEGFAGATALRCWYQLHDYIRTKRKDRGVNLYEHLEDFVYRILEYAEEKHKDEEWITLKSDDRSGDYVDLIKFFSDSSKQMTRPKPSNLQAKTIKEVQELHIKWMQAVPQLFK